MALPSPRARHARGLWGHRPAGHAADTAMSPSQACRGLSATHRFLTQKRLFPVGTPQLPEQAPGQAVLPESPVSSGQVPGPPQRHRKKARLRPGGLSPPPPAVIKTQHSRPLTGVGHELAGHVSLGRFPSFSDEKEGPTGSHFPQGTWSRASNSAGGAG